MHEPVRCEHDGFVVTPTRERPQPRNALSGADTAHDHVEAIERARAERPPRLTGG